MIMAISTKTKTSLILTYHEGVDANGKDILKTDRYGKVKITATDDEILAVSQAVSSLKSTSLVKVTKQDESNIEDA